MTLRELSKTKLFGDYVKIYFDNTYGCVGNLLTFDEKLNIGNLLTMINNVWLDKEISFLEPKNDTLIVYFKENE